MIIVTRTAIRTVSMARTVIRTFVEIIIVTTVFADSVTFASAKTFISDILERFEINKNFRSEK